MVETDDWGGVPIAAATPTSDDWGGIPLSTPKSERAPPEEQTGAWEAAGRGALSGVTAGFGDEMAGLTKASDLPAYVPSILRMGIGAGRMIGEKITGKDIGANQKYNETVDQMRKRDELLAKQHPYAHGAGEIAGSIPLMAVLPGASGIAKGATYGERVANAVRSGAQVGAESGALEGIGKGTDAENRIIGAGTGTIAGGIGGAGGGLLAEGAVVPLAKKASDLYLKPAAAVVRGWIDPEKEALRRTVGAIAEGAPNVAAGKSLGLSPQEWVQAWNRGEPVMLADLGGETGRALLRSAANTDPEGRAVITSAVQDRYQGQGERAGSFIRNLVNGGADAFERSKKLVDDYNKWRTVLYDKAYQAGDRPIISPELERLISIPAVEGSLKSAVTTGANRAGAEGFGGFNPGVKITPDGRVVFGKGGNGPPTYPNLQFWDYAYRDLRDKASAAFRAGEKDHGSALSTLADKMRSELDTIVPEYGLARGFAAKYFGGENALEAGANAVKFKGDHRELADIVRKMKDPERKLFVEGYVSELAQRMENVPDRNDITKRIFQSPADRKRIEAVVGPARTKLLQSFLDRETVYDASRQALGNSTTARQLIEAGLAGGAIGAYLGNGSPYSAAEGVAAGLTGRAGLGKVLETAGKAGAQKLIGYVDRNTARRVADLLVSDDPQKLIKGLQLVQRNPKLGAGLRSLADRASLAVGAGSATSHVPQITVHPIRSMLQSPGTVGAEENNKNNIPGEPTQQQNGGQVDQRHSRGYADGGTPSDDGIVPAEDQPSVVLGPQDEHAAAQEAAEAAAARTRTGYATPHAEPRLLTFPGKVAPAIAHGLYETGKRLATAVPSYLEAENRRLNPQEGDVISDSDVSPEDIWAGATAEAAGAIFPGYRGKFLEPFAKEVAGTAAREAAPRGVQFAANAADRDAIARNETVRAVTQTPEFKNWFGDSKIVDAEGAPQTVFHATNAAKDFDTFRRRPNDIGIHFGTEGQAADRIAYKQQVAQGHQVTGSRTIPAFLSIDKPIRLDDIGWWGSDNVYHALRGHPDFGDADTQNALRRALDSGNESGKVAGLRDLIESKGYDGIVYKNTGETAGGAELSAIESQKFKEMMEALGKKPGAAYHISALERDHPAYKAYESARRDAEDHRNNNAEDSYIAFRPTQIKSAIGNSGDFDPKNPSVLFSNKIDKDSAARNEAMQSGSVVARRLQETKDFYKKHHNRNPTTDELAIPLKVRAGQIARGLTEFNKQYPDEVYAPREELRQIREYLRSIQKNPEGRAAGGAVNDAITCEDVSAHPERQDSQQWDVHLRAGGGAIGSGNATPEQKKQLEAVQQPGSDENRSTGSAALARAHGGRTETYADWRERIGWADGGRVLARANGGRVDASNINHEPTEAQKHAGNYAKDHVNIFGLDLTIENAKGSVRRGVGRDGQTWACVLPAAYGYIKRTHGQDDDHVDCYLGPHTKSPHVFLIDQHELETGKMDEHKACLGFGSQKQALACYERAFSDGKGRARIGAVTTMTIPQFKEWLAKESEKRTHASVDYVEKATGKDHCAICKHFIAGNPPACQGVKSPISSTGYCRRYARGGRNLS